LTIDLFFFLINNIYRGAEGLIDIDLDYPDEDAITDLVNGIMEEIETVDK